MAKHYHRTQVGPLTLVALGVLAVGATLFGATQESLLLGIGLGAAVLAVAVNFGWLTVSVTAERLSLRFGVGLIRRSIPLDRIAAATPVRNSWWYGWGIRLTPHGWLWNVAGLDAVEVRYRDGGAFRIGTDDPAGLARALGAPAG